MTNPYGRFISAQCPSELVELVDDVVAVAPLVGGRSALIRHGLQLALEDMVARDMISNPHLRSRIEAHIEQKRGLAAISDN